MRTQEEEEEAEASEFVLSDALGRELAALFRDRAQMGKPEVL